MFPAEQVEVLRLLVEAGLILAYLHHAPSVAVLYGMRLVIDLYDLLQSRDEQKGE